MIIRSLIKLLSDPYYRFRVLNQHGFYKNMDDYSFLKKAYKYEFGRELNFESPSTFNEKLNWLKIHDRKEFYSLMVDKYEVKNIVKDAIGEKYVIPAYGVWNSFDEIDFDSLPNEFVLKCTHDSGGLVICKDKKTLNLKEAKKRVNKSLKKNYYIFWREWPYKNVKPRILVEKLITQPEASVLNVYKVFNFNNGKQIIQVIQGDKTPQERIDYYDDKWNLLNLYQNFKNSDNKLPRPNALEKMLSLAKKMSDGFFFLRTDFYIVNDNIYFSEFTFYSDAGLRKFNPDCWDLELGKRIKLK